MTEAMTIEEMRDASAYVLAEIADCETPDSLSSPGAKFLDSVRDGVISAIEEDRIMLDDMDDRGQLHDIADEAPSIWTHERWRQFVDLGAYQEEPEYDDSWPKDLNQTAAVALYQIADRLVRRLAEAWRAGWTCAVCGAEVDEGCDDVDGCGNPAGCGDCGSDGDECADGCAYQEPDGTADDDSPVEAPGVPVEALPIRTPGLALSEARTADMAVYTGPVDLPVSDPLLSLIDRAEATDMGIRVARRARLTDRAVSAFRWRVWTAAGVLAMLGVSLVMITR